HPVRALHVAAHATHGANLKGFCHQRSRGARSRRPATRRATDRRAVHWATLPASLPLRIRGVSGTALIAYLRQVLTGLCRSTNSLTLPLIRFILSLFPGLSISQGGG